MSDFRTEVRDRCTLLFGKIPMDALMAHTSHAPEGVVASGPLAYLTGASIAFGARADVEALADRLRAESVVVGPTRGRLTQLSLGAQYWFTHGEQGLSAATIFSRVTGVEHPFLIVDDGEPAYYPHDPGDLRRCRLLLEDAADIAGRFAAVMPRVSREWDVLVAHWDELCFLMDEECPAWRDGPGCCPRAYARMRVLLKEARH